jgi:hypothetical protein
MEKLILTVPSGLTNENLMTYKVKVKNLVGDFHCQG